MRGVILRKTATSLTSTALVTFREHVAVEAIQSGEVRFFGGSSQEAALFKYGNGSTITVGGMDKSIRIMSSEYDVAYVQEATELTEDDWEAITTRLRHGKVPYQQLIADCNPDVPYHWLKNRCDNNRTHIIYCRHEDNPRLWDTESSVWTPDGASYISKLDALTGVRHERLRLGKWAAADGLIFDTFDAQIHLHKQISEPPLSWARYWSIDFGFTNPFVLQMWAMDPDGRLYLFKEIYKTGRLVEDHAKFVREKMLKGKRGAEPAPVMVVADHDAEGRATFEEKLVMLVAHQDEQGMTTLREKLGVSTTPAHKSVLEGIEAVKARLKVQADGKPRLYICRDARIEVDQALVDKKLPTCTQEEILEYAWGKNVSHDRDRIPKEAPRKLNDHGMDAMRYLVAAVDLVGRPSIRTLTW